MARIPADAFDFYFSLGAGRSYQAVAEKFGVTKKAVLNCARREGWQRRILEIEEKARVAGDQKKVETRQAMDERHLQSLRFLQVKSLNALRALPMDSVIGAVKAFELGLRNERLIRGEPSERTAVSIEDVIKREYERWMVTAPTGDDASTDEAEEEADDGDDDSGNDNGDDLQ